MNRLKRYKHNLGLRAKGEYPGIPLDTVFGALADYLPALPPEAMMIMFGASGSGKTQF